MYLPASKTLCTGPYRSLVHRWFYEHENAQIAKLCAQYSEQANRDKETMVIKYAMGEKEILVARKVIFCLIEV
jgi:hypothetical protein